MTEPCVKFTEAFQSLCMTSELLVQAMQQSSYYMALQRHPGMALMGMPLPGMQPAPMHAPMIGYQYRPAYGQGAPMQSVVSADGSTLRLRGLPYSAGAEEIAEFFEGGALESPRGSVVKSSALLTLAASHVPWIEGIVPLTFSWRETPPDKPSLSLQQGPRRE